MRRQQLLVKDFFDRLAGGYKNRYTSKHPYHQQLFGERLEKAATGHFFSQKAILDIGAGTGPLYDHLVKNHHDVNYYACDLSEKMLAQSNIPKHRRFTGTIETIDFPLPEFDYIFALGLTTYLSRDELITLFLFIHRTLAANGKALLSFTNSSSLQWSFYNCLRSIFRRMGRSSYLISQDFRIEAYQPDEVGRLLPSGLHIEKIIWLSPTLPLFSRLLPGPSAYLARRLLPLLGEQIYSDFLVTIEPGAEPIA